MTAALQNTKKEHYLLYFTVGKGYTCYTYFSQYYSSLWFD